MFFRGTQEEFESLVVWLNSLMPGVVKFEFEFSYQMIEFLDLEIFLKDGRRNTNLFVKPTNKQLYLDFASNHPTHCKEGIPYSQSIRVVERCATPKDRDFHLTQLQLKLEERGYPSEKVKSQFEKAKEKDRKELIFKERKRRKNQ